VKNKEYFGFDGDEMYTTDEPEFMTDSEDNAGGNEMARHAVERFLEAETSDYTSSYETRKKERPERSERPERPKRPKRGQAIEAPPVPESMDDDWRPLAAPTFDDDDEFMTQLASVRKKDRPRRREPNPMPQPAVQVNKERRRAPSSSGHPDGNTDWAPLEDEDFTTFRQRYSSNEVVSPPRATRVKEPRPRGSVPVHRREPDYPEGGDGNPLRYLLAFMFVGILALMAFLALNNRNLRRDLDVYQAQAAAVNDNAVNLAQANLEINSYQALVTELRADITYLESQLESMGYVQDGEEPYVPEEAPNRPTDETPPEEVPPPPPAEPEPVIHIVQSGDVLSRIANLHYGSSTQFYIDKIVNANPALTNPNDIRIGQELVIPPRE